MTGGYKSSTTANMPVWLRVGLPSVADLIFVALLVTLVFTPLSVRLLGDAGTGWHIRTGQLILDTKAIPHTDPFSSTMTGQPWFAWEWLYDLIVGKLDRSLGLNGVVWLTAVIAAGVFAWTFRVMVAHGTNLLVALVLYLLAVSASTIHLLARPHVFGWLFALVWFSILEEYERSGSGWKRGKLWLLPLLMIFWVNLHGSFLLGFGLLAIFWLAAVWDWLQASDDRIEDTLHRLSAGRRAQELLIAGGLTVLATLANPYGWNLHRHVWSYLSDRYLMDHIDEFRPPDFHLIAPKCFLVLVLLAIVAVARRERAAHGSEMRTSAILVILFAVASGVYGSRNIPMSSLLLAIVIGPPLSPGYGWLRGFLDRMRETEMALRGHLWPIIAVLVTLGIAADGGRVGASQLMDAHFDPHRLPVVAVDHLERNQIAGPVLAPDMYGGYVIYRMYPRMLVVADDRHDLYGSAFFKSYLKLMRGEPGWEEVLRAHPAGCVLLPKDSPLVSLLLQTADWKKVYADDVAVIFVPAGGRLQSSSH
jgi:hypothetical protein